MSVTQVGRAHLAVPADGGRRLPTQAAAPHAAGSFAPAAAVEPPPPMQVGRRESIPALLPADHPLTWEWLWCAALWLPHWGMGARTGAHRDVVQTCLCRAVARGSTQAR